MGMKVYEKNTNIEILSVDEAIEELSECFKNMNSILDRVQIKDAKYSKHFDDNVRNALITVAMIKACGMCGKAECYVHIVQNIEVEQYVEKIAKGLQNAIKDSFEDHKYNARDRYEYIKNMSKRVCDYLENERFGVTEEEYNVFLNVLKEELKFRLEH